MSESRCWNFKAESSGFYTILSNMGAGSDQLHPLVGVGFAGVAIGGISLIK